MIKKLTHTFFFGNFFYGLCAVMLSIETNMQHELSLNGIHFYTILFLGTIWYYNYSYLKHIPNNFHNERTLWYKQHEVTLRQFQKIILILLIADIAFFVWEYQESFAAMNSMQYGQILLFPVIALTYTFNLLPFPEIRKLRRIGWLKPFVIGFVWSGLVSVYPVIFYQLQTNHVQADVFAMPSGLLWLKNFMFISTLCIMFDIKDFEEDKSEGLKTFTVQIGAKNTIRFIIIPLVIIGILAFVLFVEKNNFSYQRIIPNAIPYILLIITAYSLLYKKRKIIYYLFVIDGLMIVKAICGIAGMLLIK
ncbi:MAG: UbiA family prenyltransferase [Chitinophagaceae bacterium]|nr:UbiA family prenyltransferase [Chitinophagaceae bacterium]MCW5904634.1 UbiA family prenyltransferase [Chitinophagaceae bacterium]